MNSIYRLASGIGLLRTWVAAVDVVGLADLLKSDEYFTVFAPSDDAFTKLSQNYVDELLTDFENLHANISYHVVPGRIMTPELAQARFLRTLNKEELHVQSDRDLAINGARIIIANMECANGVIHIIDTVLSLKKRGKVHAGAYSRTSRLRLA